jgi:hypothetical protein
MALVLRPQRLKWRLQRLFGFNFIARNSKEAAKEIDGGLGRKQKPSIPRSFCPLKGQQGAFGRIVILAPVCLRQIAP